MKEKKDNLLLENLYQEGIWDRLKGQGAGIKAGASTLGQGLKNKAISALGGTPTKEPSNTAGQSYAKAQQSSLLKSFQSKIKKEIDDFKNDLKKFKVDPDEKDFSTTFPTIAQKLQELDKLEKFLQNPTSEATPTDAPEATSEATPTDAPEATSEATPTAEATPEPTKDVLNSDEASSYLGISKEELFKKVQTGEIPGIKLGTKGYIFPKQNIIKAKQNLSSNEPKSEEPKQNEPLGSTGEDAYRFKAGNRTFVDDEGQYDTAEQAYGKDELESQPDVFGGIKKDWTKPPENWMSSGEENKTTPRTTPKKFESKPPFTKQTETEAPVNSTVKYNNSPYIKTENGWMTLKNNKPFQKVVGPKIIQNLESIYIQSKIKPKGSQKPVKGDSNLTARERSFMTPAQRRAKETTSESYNPFGEFLKENNLI